MKQGYETRPPAGKQTHVIETDFIWIVGLCGVNVNSNTVTRDNFFFFTMLRSLTVGSETQESKPDLIQPNFRGKVFGLGDTDV